MDLDEARAFLRARTHVVLATTRSDGRTQMAPVLAGVDGEGRVVISSRETAYKTRHLRRDPRASLLALSDNFFGDWIQVEGTARIVSLPEAMDLLVDVYRLTGGGEHPDWDEYRRAMVAEQRCVIVISIERAGPDRRG